jgi:ParB-like chromosome segregation protein Spo0J
MDGCNETKTGILDIALGDIRESYGRFRLVRPADQAAVERSLLTYGQLSPVVVSRLGADRGVFELIDGFKRLRAARKLGIFGHLKGRVLEAGIHATKVAVVHLNAASSSLSDFEEALVLHSLFHDDCLTQVEISRLFSRHKSWVCRRISLIDRLCEEVQEQIRLGLITMTTGRELAKLPRGNQAKALSTIQKYHMCSRETTRLVADLQSSPRWEQDRNLDFPAEILEARMPPKPKDAGEKPSRIREVEKQLLGLAPCCQSLSQLIPAVNPASGDELARLLAAYDRVMDTLRETVIILERAKSGWLDGTSQPTD